MEDHSNDAYTKIIVSLARNIPNELKASFAHPCLELGGQIDTSNHEYFKYYTVSLSKVVYDKQMFRPGSVILTFTLTTKEDPGRSLQETSRHILQKMNFIDLIGVKDNVPVNNCSESDLVYIARNYYMQSHHVQTIGANECTITLKCYSFDRKLSLSKYCNVYTGRNIATGIAKDGIDSQLSAIKPYLEELIQKEKPENTTSSTDNVYFSDNSLSNINLNNLLMLGYYEDYSDGKVYSARRTYDRNNKELKHPYLVQYNESFYDFLSRVLHRCGEFFYFEHGKINIGLPEATRQFIFDVTGDSVPEVPADHHFSPLCSYSDNVSGESSEEVESGIDSYGSDYINTPASSPIDSSRKYRDAETTSDEALHVVTEEDNRYHPCGMWILYKALGNHFIADSFIMGIGYAAGYAVWDLINTLFVLPVFCVDPDYKKHHLENGENLKDVNNLGENARVDSIGADEIANLCNNYFRDIDRWEKTSAETLVKVNFESVLRQIYLGDVICLDNLADSPACIVVSMHGEYSGKEVSNTAEVIPIIRMSEKKGGLYAVTVPVASQVEHIKKVSTMEAVVTDTRDPLRLGRVRVRYPWQPEGTEDKSPWLRVKVPFAGGTKERYKDSYNPGFCMTPGEGEHVALDYTGGNIERPFVSGSFYYLSRDGESDHVPPMASIHNGSSRFFKTDHQFRTIASGKGHALVFEDLENTDLLSQAIPLARVITQACQLPEFNETGKYQANEVFGTIQGGSVTLRDGTGITTISLKPNEREIAIDSRLGKVSLNAFTGININAPNGDVVIKGKNVSIQAGNNLSIQSGTNIQDGDSQRLVSETLAGVLGMVGGIAACSVIACMTGVDLSNAFDLSFLRSVVETALRPVEGTLCLRSRRNVMMTAGMGHVTLTSSMMSKSSTYTGNKDSSGSKMTAFSDLASSKANDAAVENGDYVAVRNFIAGCVKQAETQYNAYRDNLLLLMPLLEQAKEMFDGLGDFQKKYWDPNRDYSTCKKIYEKIKADGGKMIKSPEDMFPDYKKLNAGDSKKISQEQRPLLAAYHNYVYLHCQLLKAVEKLEHPLTYEYFMNQCIMDDSRIISTLVCGSDKEKILSSIKEPWDELQSGLFKGSPDELFGPEYFNYSADGVKDEVASMLLKVKKYIIIKTLLAFSKVKIKKVDKGASGTMKQTEGGFSESFDDGLKKMVKGELPWGQFAPLVVKNTDNLKNESSTKTFWKSLANGILNYLGTSIEDPLKSFKRLVNYNGASGPRAFSDPGGNGNILISSDPGHFSVYDDTTHQWNRKYNPDPWVIKKYIATIDQSKK